MPVQYLAINDEGQDETASLGDHTMYQTVPPDQFLSRYTFSAGGMYFDVHYAQVIRRKGNPDVVVDGQIVTGYHANGDYEAADVRELRVICPSRRYASYKAIDVGRTKPLFQPTPFCFPKSLFGFKHVNDKRDAYEASPGCHIREISHPKLVGLPDFEVTFDEVFGLRRIFI